MAIPTQQQWLKDTGLGVLRPRSTQMKAIDEAIAQYERARMPSNLWKIKNALEDWKRSKGANWKSSDRNRGGAITRLDEELGKVADPTAYRVATFTAAELKALAYVAEERKKVIAKVFEGKEVRFRNSPRAFKDAAVDAARDVEASAAKAREWLSGQNRKPSVFSTSDLAKQKLEAMVKAIFQVDTLDKLGTISGLVIDIVGKAGVSVAPVVGHIKDGYDLFTGWARVGADLYELHGAADRAYVIDTGSPAAAFAALKTCLADQAKDDAKGAALATSAFALKTGLAFVDGGAISGPVVGVANALASLALQLTGLAMEWRATQAINEALKAGKLDVTLFETYPLMGCYMLTSATFSDLIPLDCFGTPGWMDYMENLKKRGFDGLYESSNNLIDKSPWEIPGLPKRAIAGKGIHTGMLANFGSGLKDLGGNLKDVFS